MANLRDSMSISKANRMSKRAARDSVKGKDAEVVNPRVWNMFREAVEFKSAAIVPFGQELRDLETATIEYCEGVLPLLRAPLPRVWDRVGDGGPLAEPLRASVTHYGHPDISGGYMDDAAVRASVADFERNLQLKVRRPLTQWVNALEGVRGRIPELDRLRKQLEVRTRKVKTQEKKAEKEERRRAGVRRAGRGFVVGKTFGVKALLYQCTHPTADISKAEPTQAVETPDPNAEAAVPSQDYKQEDLDVRYKEELRKLQASSEAFSSDEGLLYEQLSGLCQDAAWMKSYIASALLMTKELFQEMAIELGDCLQPLPACKLPLPDTAARGLRSLMPAGPIEGAPDQAGMQALAAAPTERKLGSILPYVAAMPDYAHRGHARRTLEEWKEVARKRLHAHMATSSPLELHAVPQARAGDIPGKSRGGSRAMSVADQQEQAAKGTAPLSGSAGSALEMRTPTAPSKVQPPETPEREEPPAGLGYS